MTTLSDDILTRFKITTPLRLAWQCDGCGGSLDSCSRHNKSCGHCLCSDCQSRSSHSCPVCFAPLMYESMPLRLLGSPEHVSLTCQLCHMPVSITNLVDHMRHCGGIPRPEIDRTIPMSAMNRNPMTASSSCLPFSWQVANTPGHQLSRTHSPDFKDPPSIRRPQSAPLPPLPSAERCSPASASSVCSPQDDLDWMTWQIPRVSSLIDRGQPVKSPVLSGPCGSRFCLKLYPNFKKMNHIAIFLLPLFLPFEVVELSVAFRYFERSFYRRGFLQQQNPSAAQQSEIAKWALHNGRKVHGFIGIVRFIDHEELASLKDVTLTLNCAIMKLEPALSLAHRSRRIDPAVRV